MRLQGKKRVEYISVPEIMIDDLFHKGHTKLNMISFFVDQCESLSSKQSKLKFWNCGRFIQHERVLWGRLAGPFLKKSTNFINIDAINKISMKKNSNEKILSTINTSSKNNAEKRVWYSNNLLFEYFPHCTAVCRFKQAIYIAAEEGCCTHPGFVLK